MKFELVSGAILSRNFKCKVIGFGRWRNKVNWPLDYLQVVQEIKVFGVYIMNSYRDLLRRNWEYRFAKFQQMVISWSPRHLDTLSQRVMVIKTFGLSRIYYLASVLPLPRMFLTKINKLITKFVWSLTGKVLKVSLNEMKLSPDKGGMGFV